MISDVDLKDWIKEPKKMKNEYCFKVSETMEVWVYASSEEEAESMVYEQLGYDPEEMDLIEVREDV
jgi:hypothetical protein